MADEMPAPAVAAPVDDGAGGRVESDPSGAALVSGGEIAPSLAEIGVSSAGEPQGDWREGLSDENRRYVEGKNYRDTDAALASAREAEASLRRLQGDYQALLAARPEPAPNGQTTPDPMAKSQADISDVAHYLAEQVEAGNMDTAQGMGALVSYMYEQLPGVIDARIAATVDQRLGPVESQVGEQALQRTFDNLETTYGDQFREVGPEIVSMMQRDPGSYRTAQQVEGLFGLVMAKRHQQQARAQAAQRAAESPTTSSRGPRPQTPDPAEVLKARLDSFGAEFDDGAGGRRIIR